MSMDGLSLYACLTELSCLAGGKIDKVQQPERDTLLFSVRSAGKTYRLLICIHAENGRLQLTEEGFENPPEPPAFCMLLRRRLVGARIERMEQLGLDRYVCLTLSARSELDDPITLRLCIELMGRHSNVTLVQDGVILDCLRHVSPAMSSVRVLLPGAAYQEPPVQAEKDSLFDADAAALAALVAAPNAAKQLQARYAGLSRTAAAALLGDAPDANRLLSAIAALKAGEIAPTLLQGGDGEPLAVLPFVPAPGVAAARRFSSMWAAYDHFYRKRDALVRIARHSASLRHSLETHLRRAENKLTAYLEAIEGEAQCEQYRLYGELITANLHLLARGQSALQAENYYLDPPQPCTVPLDPLLSPSENAQRYFKRYRKSRAARAYAERMRGAVQEEIAYLEGQLDNIGKCDTLQELSEIREELVQQGYLRPERRGPKPQKRPPSEPMRFLSGDGIPILVGKNNRQNDSLTLKRAAADNLWLHTKNIPGSHVIVDYPGMPPERTLLEAAQLAAYFSKARRSAAVPVDYTPRRFVKKPTGAKPGMVIYTTNQTIYVTPEETLVRTLAAQQEQEDRPCD